jgi:hypothetical protein
MDVSDRFWARVQVGPLNECWPWTGGRSRFGYGRMHKSYAHRVAWSLQVGPIPTGLQVLHACDNPPCCNPAHLFLGTPADNVLDKVQKGRQAHGEDISNRVRLTEQHVRQIRLAAATGVTYRALATAYGVSRSGISLVVRGKRWAWVA